VILNCSFLLQGFAYAFVVLYSLFIGTIDYIIPVKVAYATVLICGAVLAIIEVNSAYNNRGADLSRLGLNLIRLGIEVSAVIGGVAVGYFFIVSPIYSVSLTSLSLALRAIVVIGILISLVYPVNVTIGFFRDLLRKRPLPPVIVTPRGGDDDE